MRYFRREFGMEEQIEGLGDMVVWVVGKLGFKPWEGCGCARRRAWLNRHTQSLFLALGVVLLGSLILLCWR